MEPGVDPFRTMIEQNLLPCSVLIGVYTRAAIDSHWVTWETASAWGLRKLVIPVFVDVSPADIKSPLAILRQGGRVTDRAWLNRALERVANELGATECDALTDDEFEVLAAFAVSS